MNSANLLGKITAIGVAKVTTNNIVVVNLELAVAETKKNGKGERLKVTVFGALAEQVNDLRVGDQVFIQGRVRTSSYGTEFVAKSITKSGNPPSFDNLVFASTTFQLSRQRCGQVAHSVLLAGGRVLAMSPSETNPMGREVAAIIQIPKSKIMEINQICGIRFQQC